MRAAAPRALVAARALYSPQANKDCWFLGALSVVAERDKLFYALFNSEEVSPCGVYSCSFYQNGKWEDVLVDDFIPITYGDRPLNARGSSLDEIWVPLIEKAFAKLNGCYEALISGSESEAFVAMTGCPVRHQRMRTRNV